MSTPPPERTYAKGRRPLRRRRSPTPSRPKPTSAPSPTRARGPTHSFSKAYLSPKATPKVMAMMPTQLNQLPPMSDSRSRPPSTVLARGAFVGGGTASSVNASRAFVGGIPSRGACGGGVCGGASRRVSGRTPVSMS